MSAYDEQEERARALGRELRALQERANLTNREAGALAGMSGAHVSHIHTGQRSASIAALARLARACGAELVISLRPAAPPRGGRMTDTEAEARRDECTRIVAWLRQEAARYRRLEPTLSPAARALESVAYLIEPHAPHTVDLPAPVEAHTSARCTHAWTQVSWPHREVRCDRPEGHDGSHSTTVVGSTMVPHTEQFKGA